MLAGGVVFLVEYLDDTIKTPEQVEQTLQLAVIGYVADVQKTKVVDRGMYVSSQPRSPIAESFRSIRTNLEFSSVDHPLRTLLITSAGPGEGKSTFAANLAAIVAQSGKKVALIDADLRRPSVHRFFNMENRDGLTDAFRDQIELEAVSQKWELDENISVITSGSLPPNPTELLASERMSHLLDFQKKNIDLIIIDSPPSIVTDPQVLAAKVDGVVIVVWPGHTQMNGVRSTLEQLNRVGANVVGIVFNRIPQNRGSYYGGYKHYSQYYYRNYHYHTDDGSSVTSYKSNTITPKDINVSKENPTKREN
jgi:polysaccharide biosynthesis transport protein